ncbi:glycosyltransferase [Arthrobacter sp. zg-Y769]|uniref:glycosyltransferase n=1 Tax=Arthrobacter sp. zg-Y769 TaxID=2894191 RepID=UPI001E64E419|nr:glycosyltransferase [Arthrobacter sp. zg-Y769]MCC9203588.1 glycosyltransferase [Arthrobacter sp. zg-Y769]
MQPHSSPVPVTIVVVTFNRSGYLSRLLESIAAMSTPAARVIVVDNASTDDTSEVAAAAPLPSSVLRYERLETNTGGAGGFSAGVELAMEEGAEWIWVMDDDVEVVPDALAKLSPWTEKFQCLHGRREDADGTPYFWQHRMVQSLGVPMLTTSDPFAGGESANANVGCFEGMLIHRDIVARIGLPDPRFFITWDDTVYGWLASQHTEVGYVNEFVLRRARPLKTVPLGSHQVNTANDLFRFHLMRNRAYIAKYFARYGTFRRIPFAAGTAFTFAKEIYRCLVAEKSLKGLRPLVKGLLAGRKIHADRTWQPMPALEGA